MTLFRLDTLFPQVAAQFRCAGPDARRRAARVACEYAATAARLFGGDVEDALRVLRESTPAEEDLRVRLESRTEELDEEYLQLGQDDAPSRKAEALELFSKARAISALAHALLPEDSSLHESIYEALSALEDPTPLLALIQEALE